MLQDRSRTPGPAGTSAVAARDGPRLPFVRTGQARSDMAGNSILVINAAGAETRVALIESGTIHEYYLERKREKGIVGNIYKGRVVRVLPGMQAAFVDIGLEKAAFLYVGDVYGDPDFSEEFELTEGEHSAEVAEVPDEQEAEAEEARR